MLLCFVDRRKKRRKDRKTTHATAQATAHATAHATRYSTRKNTRFKTRKNTQATTDSQSQHKSQRDICPPRFFCSVHLHVLLSSIRRGLGGRKEVYTYITYYPPAWLLSPMRRGPGEASSNDSYNEEGRMYKPILVMRRVLGEDSELFPRASY